MLRSNLGPAAGSTQNYGNFRHLPHILCHKDHWRIWGGGDPVPLLPREHKHTQYNGPVKTIHAKICLRLYVFRLMILVLTLNISRKAAALIVSAPIVKSGICHCSLRGRSHWASNFASASASYPVHIERVTLRLRVTQLLCSHWAPNITINFATKFVTKNIKWV